MDEVCAKRQLTLNGPAPRLCFPGRSDSEGSACHEGDLGSISGSGRSSGEGDGNHSSVLAWEIPGTEEPGGL